MKSQADQIEQALKAPGRATLLEALGPRRPVLTLPDIKRVTQLLRSFEEIRQPLKVAIVHTYTT